MENDPHFNPNFARNRFDFTVAKSAWSQNGT
jgi:hypothetical protein